VGRHTGRRENDVAVGSAPDEDGLFSESGDHARIEVITLFTRCRAGKLRWDEGALKLDPLCSATTLVPCARKPGWTPSARFLSDQ
jgi:hypothetical protein